MILIHIYNIKVIVLNGCIHLWFKCIFGSKAVVCCVLCVVCCVLCVVCCVLCVVCCVCCVFCVFCFVCCVLCVVCGVWCVVCVGCCLFFVLKLLHVKPHVVATLNQYSLNANVWYSFSSGTYSRLLRSWLRPPRSPRPRRTTPFVVRWTSPSLCQKSHHLAQIPHRA